MKNTLFLLLVIISLNGFSSELEGFSNINDGVKNFFLPLKKGPKHINDAISNLSGIENESRRFAESQVGSSSSDFKGELSKIMISDQQGKVISYKETDSREKLNGSYVIKTYEVKFFGGKSKSIEFKFLKPTINGNYQFVDVNFLD